MDFREFLQLLPKIQNTALPGEQAQFKMAPPERREIMQSINLDTIQARPAGVMLLLYPRNEKATLVLILRNAYNGVHSSQVAFPGGKYETEDLSLEITALRETHEEVGIAPEQLQVIRPLSRIYIPPSNFIVHPFLSYSTEDLIFNPQPSEVAGIIEVSLDDLLDGNNVVTKRMATSYNESIEVPCFQLGDNMVWGATAMVLSEFVAMMQEVMA